MGTSRELVDALYDVSPHTDVALRLDDGDRVVGRPSRVARDQAGVRVEVCPYGGDAPQYRVRAARTPTGWRDPQVERRPLLGEWTRCARLVDLAPVDAAN